MNFIGRRRLEAEHVHEKRGNLVFITFVLLCVCVNVRAFKCLFVLHKRTYMGKKLHFNFHI